MKFHNRLREMNNNNNNKKILKIQKSNNNNSNKLLLKIKIFLRCQKSIKNS